ncbi:hypothetical protein SLS62_000358 [Diatrype stigma]|uniref:Cytochrome c oxidase assembly protein COX20, mitochondrial n=1 Tax=Diatrype stigma TaxID=117547 RepID=A0AAN9V0M9_9PEZI
MARDADHDRTDSIVSPPPGVRGPPPGAGAEPPEHVKKPQVYEIFHGSSNPESQDGVPTSRPEGGETQQPPAARPTLKDGIQTIKPDDFFSVHKIPCARQGLLTGIGAGAVVGAGRYIFGARIPKAANWAFGTFVLGSVIQFELCQAARYQEKAAMARAVEIIDRKKAEKAAAAEEAALLSREAQEKAAAAAKKSWYRFW